MDESSSDMTFCAPQRIDANGTTGPWSLGCLREDYEVAKAKLQTFPVRPYPALSESPQAAKPLRMHPMPIKSRLTQVLAMLVT